MKPKTKSSTIVQKSQHDQFKETARALGCDEDEAAFDEKLKAIARQKPKDVPASKDRAPKTKSK